MAQPGGGGGFVYGRDQLSRGHGLVQFDQDAQQRAVARGFDVDGDLVFWGVRHGGDVGFVDMAGVECVLLHILLSWVMVTLALQLELLKRKQRGSRNKAQLELKKAHFVRFDLRNHIILLHLVPCLLQYWIGGCRRVQKEGIKRGLQEMLIWKAATAAIAAAAEQGLLSQAAPQALHALVAWPYG